jgi:hypothetical protein
MKRYCLLNVLFLCIAVAAMAQRRDDSFRYGNFLCKETSATTVSIVGIGTRIPDRPRPFTYYFEKYDIPSTLTTDDGKTYTVTEIGEEAFVLRSDVQDEEEGLMTWQDLTGYTMEDDEAGVLGVIDTVDESTINTLAILTDGRMVPLHEDFILDIDQPARVLHVHLPFVL